MRNALKLALLLLGPFTCLVSGQTATGTMAVSATVLKVCITAATPMTFGNYTASSGTANTTTSTVTVTCTVGTTYTVALNAGTASGATTSTRSMSYLTNLLSYGIFRDSGHSLNWGNNTGVDTVAGTATGLVQSITAYGQISTGQYGTPGAYVDTITVSVTY